MNFMSWLHRLFPKVFPVPAVPAADVPATLPPQPEPPPVKPVDPATEQGTPRVDTSPNAVDGPQTQSQDPNVNLSTGPEIDDGV